MISSAAVPHQLRLEMSAQVLVILVSKLVLKIMDFQEFALTLLAINCRIHGGMHENVAWHIHPVSAIDNRERCLAPLQLALESKSTKLASYAVAGMQVNRTYCIFMFGNFLCTPFY